MNKIKTFFSVMAISIVLSSSAWALSAGFSACVGAGGGTTACQAGFDACMCDLYGYCQ